METINLKIADITKDRRLQARPALDDATVEDYAQRLKDGVRFPPIRLIRVFDEGAEPVALPLGGLVRPHRLYAVDGYHRLAAHERAGLEDVSATIETGTWRDCILAAAAANSSHGLPRSNEAKRRAALMLLQDEECAKLSSRKLADLADVSHTLVNELRTEFAVKVGEVITDKAIARKDGTPTGKWVELLNRVPNSAYTYAIERIRKATSPRHIADDPHGELENEATLLRREELRAEGGEWPYEILSLARSKADEIRWLALRMSTSAELNRALQCRELPADLLPVLYPWLRDALLIEQQNEYMVDRVLERHAPNQLHASQGIFEAARGLKAMLAEKKRKAEARAVSEAKKRPDPQKDEWGYVKWLKSSPESVQAKEILSVPVGALSYVYPRELAPSVVAGAWRERTRKEKGDRLCPNPRCASKGGWIDFKDDCVVCRKDFNNHKQEIMSAISLTSGMITAGLHMTVTLGADTITVDAALLGALADLQRTPPEGYPAAARGLRALLDRPPTALFPDATPAPEPEPEPEEEPEEEDVDEEEDGDWEGLVGDPEGEDEEA